MTETDVDPVRAFTSHLGNAAHHHLHVNYQTIPLIRAGVAKHGAAGLARIVAHGIGWTSPANPWPTMLFRLQREAGTANTDTPEDCD